ncbi:MAG: TIGR03936 family radical SAM-associated protein [Bacillota bacterium]
MLNVKFNKSKTTRFISHNDMQRGLIRVFKRAGFTPNFSMGYNPHVLLKMSSPIPLGLVSESEYFSLSIDNVDKDDFITRCNNVAPTGMEFTASWISSINPNFAGKVIAADYIIESTELAAIADRLVEDTKVEFIIPQKSKNGELGRDVSDTIYSISADSNCVYIRMAFGNTTVRMDKFLQAVNSRYGINVPLSAATKKEMLFDNGDGTMISVSDVLDKLEASNEVNK